MRFYTVKEVAEQFFGGKVSPREVNRLFHQGKLAGTRIGAKILIYADSLEALVKAGNLKHDGNPVTNWMISNVCCRVDKKDNIFPFKEGNENKIDGAVALITAMARAMYTQSDESSIYSKRGVLVF